MLAALAAATLACAGYAADLRAMVAADQALRDGGPMRPMDVVDVQNTARLKRWLKACGWPKKSVHGEGAVNDAWLLAQHADRDPAFQQQALKLLAARVAEGEAHPGQLAYLTDRVELAAGRPQRYGTQLNLSADCALSFRPMDDEARVDERRRAVGLPPLEEYRRVVKEHAMPEHCR